MTLNSPCISPAAHAHLAEYLATCRALGDQAGMALALRELGLIAWWQGDYSAAPTTRAVCGSYARATRRSGLCGSVGRRPNAVPGAGDRLCARRRHVTPTIDHPTQRSTHASSWYAIIPTYRTQVLRSDTFQFSGEWCAARRARRTAHHSRK